MTSSLTNDGTNVLPILQRRELSKRVAAVITRKAKDAGLSDAAYFREIMDGRAPRITQAEARTAATTESTT
jgi:hypothetical protein